MNDDTREIEAALGSLRPRSLPAGLEARLSEAVARGLPARPSPRPRVIPFVAWSAAACAACLALYLALPAESPSPAALAQAAPASAADLPPPALARSAPAESMSRAAPALRSAAAPDLRLVRAEQTPAEVTLLEPVRVADGLFARPVQVRWHNAAHYRDPRGGAELVRHAPHDEVIGLVPFETD